MKGRQYRLFSVVNHKGTQLNRGHYICYSLDSQDQWIMCDDEKIRKVNDDVVSDSQAYILFYELVL